MARGVTASSDDLRALAPHRAAELAAAADPPLNRRTAERAKAGEPVHPLCLRALLAAAGRLAERGCGAAA